MMSNIRQAMCTAAPELAIHTADPNPNPNPTPNHVHVPWIYQHMANHSPLHSLALFQPLCYGQLCTVHWGTSFTISRNSHRG